MARKSNTRSAAGQGSIRQRPDGRWEGRFIVGYDHGTGKNIRRSVYGNTQKEVRQQMTADNEYEYEYENDNVLKKESKKKKAAAFVPPALEEVKEYCLNRGNGIDAQRFIDFYTARGWMLGKNKMKDWRAAVRTWEKSEPKKLEPKKELTIDDFYN